MPNYTNKGILNLIAELSGHNKVSGGPTASTNAAGEQVFTYSPFDAKKGFLSRYGSGRNTADELNARIGGEAFLGQEEGKRRIKEIELGGKEQRLSEQERGTQDRLTQAEKHKLESLLGKERASQIIDEIKERGGQDRQTQTEKQHGDVLGKRGITFSPANASAHDIALTPKLMQNAILEEEMNTGILANPRVTESAITGAEQKNLQSLFQNQQLSEVNAGPNQISTFQELTPDKPLGARKRVEGPKEFNTINQTGGYTDPSGNTMGGKATITRGYKGGGIFPMVDPKLMEEAANITEPEATPEAEMEVLRKLLKKYPNAAGGRGTNSPPFVVPSPGGLRGFRGF